jgi:tetratricopeptide (TPR) repeat protein
VYARAAHQDELVEIGQAMQDGELDEHSFEVLQRNAMHNAHDWRAHAMLGQAHGHMGNSDGAIDSLRRALAMAPTVAQVAIALAGALRTSGVADNVAESPTIYRTALELAPTAANVYMDLGQTLASLQDYRCDRGTDTEPVVQAWTAAAVLRPFDADIAQRLARHLCSCSLERRAEAIASARRAVKLAPLAAEAYDLLGAALFMSTSPTAFKKRERKEAEATLRTAIQLRSTDWRGLSAPRTKHNVREQGSNNARGTEDRRHATAWTHYRLSRLLGTHPKLDAALNEGRIEVSSYRAMPGGSPVTTKLSPFRR